MSEELEKSIEQFLGYPASEEGGPTDRVVENLQQLSRNSTLPAARKQQILRELRLASAKKEESRQGRGFLAAIKSPWVLTPSFAAAAAAVLIVVMTGAATVTLQFSHGEDANLAKGYSSEHSEVLTGKIGQDIDVSIRGVDNLRAEEIENGLQLSFIRGSMLIQYESKPHNTLLIKTPHGGFKVLGTRFLIHSDNHQAFLIVGNGQVQFLPEEKVIDAINGFVVESNDEQTGVIVREGQVELTRDEAIINPNQSFDTFSHQNFEVDPTELREFFDNFTSDTTLTSDLPALKKLRRR